MQEFSYTLPLASTTFPGPVVRNIEFLPDILLPGCMYSFVIGIKAGDINRGKCVKITTIWLFQILSSLPNFHAVVHFAQSSESCLLCPEYLVVITVLQVFSYNLVIITGRERL